MRPKPNQYKPPPNHENLTITKSANSLIEPSIGQTGIEKDNWPAVLTWSSEGRLKSKPCIKKNL